VSLYRVSQGIHIAAGIACVPLLLAKLWIVFPELLTYPPVTGIVSFLERASIAVFVGASLLEVAIGLLNTFQWVPFPFYFRQTHWALAFVVVGSLAIHIGVKLPAIAGHWRRGQADESPIVEEAPAVDAPATVSSTSAPRGVTGRVIAWIDDTPVTPAPVARRGFLVAVGASVAAVVGLTAGQSFRFLAPVNAFGPRVMGTGPQALPVNRTAEAARVTESAMDPAWTLTVTAGSASRAFTMADLRGMELVTAKLPIACVEGWSQSATWRGVRLRDLMDAVGADPGARLRVTSLEQRGGFRRTEMGPEYVRDPLTLVALELDGAPLDIQHGYPARMIAPGRPGVLQTKWLSTLEVVS
jgi:hypothetical protein